MVDAALEMLREGPIAAADGYGLGDRGGLRGGAKANEINRDILGLNRGSRDEHHSSSTVASFTEIMSAALLGFAAFLLQTKTDGRVGHVVSGIFFPSERGTL